MAGATLMVSVNPTAYDQLKDTECLQQVLGTVHSNVINPLSVGY
jgi:hypothetical protein